jgi:hypothetical protein
MSRIYVWVVAGTVSLMAVVGWLLTGTAPWSTTTNVLAAQTTVEQPGSAVELYLVLGIKDTEQVDWDGSVSLSEGQVRQIRIIQAARNGKVEGATFSVRSARPGQQQKKKKKANDALVPARLQLSLDAPLTARVSVNTSQGNFSFVLQDLRRGQATPLLDGKASAERREGAVCLTNADTEDDFPALATDKNGRIWLAYVAFHPSPPLINERVVQGDFDLLVPETQGDQILLRALDGEMWQIPQPVTEPRRDVWRPSVTVDGQGRVCVAWAEKIDGDWEIMARQYDPAANRWADTTRVTSAPGSDFHAVTATDAEGRVWLAWQAWRDGGYDILLSSADTSGRWSAPETISQSKANDWSPAICADSQGHVYVAWDTYDRGQYDVQLIRKGGSEIQRLLVADTPRFEARPHLLCDALDRVWVAYEEGDEQWGKDYLSENAYQRVGFESNPGFALYVERTVRVKCLVAGSWQQTVDDLEAAMTKSLSRNKSHPRLGMDGNNGIWLLFRHHPLPGGNGEAWHSYAFRYSGNGWEGPRELTNSSNLLDNRPATAAHGEGLLVVYSGDYRTRTQDRGQDDLFSAVLPAGSQAAAAELEALPADTDAEPRVNTVHPNEAADIAALREFRFWHQNKSLRLLRGEFHRHTEYTAHRDQDGSLEDSWRYALDAASLDWMGNGDHDNGSGSEYMWWQIQKISDLHHHPPRFVAAMTYERSLQYPNGHRNVMMPRRGIRPLPRGSLESSEETGTVDTKNLYAYLKHFGGICASHTSGTNMGTDWRDNDPEVEPVVEIYQGHRHNYEHFGAPRSATEETQIGGYRPAGFVWNALEKGYRLGFQSSSDHVSTHISYAMVLAEEHSRPAIIEAFRRRHCYAATDNILLVVHSGDHLMGDVLETTERPRLNIECRGTAPVARIHVVRNNQYVYTAEPNERNVRQSFTDMEAEPGKSYYYYVRVEQADGNLAWASPMWITYRGNN